MHIIFVIHRSTKLTHTNTAVLLRKPEVGGEFVDMWMQKTNGSSNRNAHISLYSYQHKSGFPVETNLEESKLCCHLHGSSHSSECGTHGIQYSKICNSSQKFSQLCLSATNILQVNVCPIIHGV